jgi:hypothetical protein
MFDAVYERLPHGTPVASRQSTAEDLFLSLSHHRICISGDKLRRRVLERFEPRSGPGPLVDAQLLVRRVAFLPSLKIGYPLPFRVLIKTIGDETEELFPAALRFDESRENRVEWSLGTLALLI